MNNRIFQPVSVLFCQLQQLLSSLPDEQYYCAIPVLSNASIGQHVRHIIEFFLELNSGYETGYVNYDARKRDKEIEVNKNCAVLKLKVITDDLNKINKPLLLTTNLSTTDDDPYFIDTHYERELLYNMEHTVHHMALIRIGVNAVSEIKLPETFGVAVSTLKSKKLIAG